MDKFTKFFDGKKTYISAAVAAILGILGVSDEVAKGGAENYAQLLGILVATAGTFYGRYVATRKVKKVRKTRKQRAKKVTVENA